jgi:hypothetical protein
VLERLKIDPEDAIRLRAFAVPVNAQPAILRGLPQDLGRLEPKFRGSRAERQHFRTRQPLRHPNNPACHVA